MKKLISMVMAAVMVLTMPAMALANEGGQARKTPIYQDTCPYGSPSEYTVYEGTEKNGNIELTEFLEDLTAGTLEYIIFKVSGYAAGISYIIAEALIKDFGQETKGLSYKAEVYGHEDGLVLNTKYQKLVTTWYSDIGYKGDTTTVVFYRIIEYN